MRKGLEALHHPRIKSAKVDISAEGKHDIAYMFFEDTKQYAVIEKELKALDVIKEIDKTSLLHLIAICVKDPDKYDLLKEVLS